VIRIDPPTVAPVQPSPPVVLWTAEHKSRVEGYVTKWAPVLFLDHHHINITFAEAPKGPDDKCAADAYDNHPYESGHRITFYPDFLNFKPEVLAERAALHELVHLITALPKELFSAVINREKFVPWREYCAVDERLTDWLANIVFELSGPR
jgi:hypothetical protein